MPYSSKHERLHNAFLTFCAQIGTINDVSRAKTIL